MADSVKIRSGTRAKMPRLAPYELGWTTDERRLYIGTSGGNVSVTVLLENAVSQINASMISLAESIRPIAYPVGAVYTSTSNTDPTTLFGGTWVSVPPQSPYFKDDVTGESYRVGSEDGMVYVEDVADAPTYYSWKRIS